MPKNSDNSQNNFNNFPKVNKPQDQNSQQKANNSPNNSNKFNNNPVPSEKNNSQNNANNNSQKRLNFSGKKQNNPKNNERRFFQPKKIVEQPKVQKLGKVAPKTLRFIPLGGNGQVTKNMFVYEYGDDIVLVDCGMGFPSEQLYGVDMVIPDISYLRDKKKNIRGLFITHGHEDHIGAIPFLIDQLGVPVYGLRLTVGLIREKLKEVNKLNTTTINEIQPRQKIRLGAFEVEAFRVSHSIPDSCGYAITTPLGTTIHTGDFKFDWTPVDGKVTDADTLTEYGSKGVLALMSDCLRSEKPGNTLSEAAIGQKFADEMEKAKGRVIITTFASNISRVQQAITASIKYNRKICVIGRSMENNLLTAQNLGYLSFPRDLFIKQDQIDRTNDKNVTLIVAGSQGQPGSALNRIANGDHRFVFVKPNDLIIFSADPIPGNQDAVYEMIDNLSRLGATVRYSDITSDFHVSGHAAQDELILMLSLTKPKYVVPISAMHRMMTQYALLAESTGVPRENVFIVDEAGVIEFGPNGAKITGEIETENIFVDGIGVGDVGEIVLRDRKVLAEEGIVVVILTVDKVRNQLHGEPDIVSRGFVYMKESEPLIKEAAVTVKKSLGSDSSIKNWLTVREKITSDLEKFLYQKTQRKPMVVPVIVDI